MLCRVILSFQFWGAAILGENDCLDKHDLVLAPCTLDAPALAANLVGMTQPSAPQPSATQRSARFKIGDIVQHRVYPFRGVVFDVDPVFSNTEEWLQSIPAEIRPHRDQPFYHLFAENADTTYVAYVSEQNLLPDESGRACRHPMIRDVFEGMGDGAYRLKAGRAN